MNKIEILKEAIKKIEYVCGKIINKENYMEEMSECVQAINAACMILMEDTKEQEMLIPMLEDVVYGMTQTDDVFLLDVLRFGMKTRLETWCDKLENNMPEGVYE